jgi:hypothetical protein
VQSSRPGHHTVHADLFYPKICTRGELCHICTPVAECRSLKQPTLTVQEHATSSQKGQNLHFKGKTVDRIFDVIAHLGWRFEGTTKVQVDSQALTETYTIWEFQKFSEKTQNLRDQCANSEWDCWICGCGEVKSLFVWNFSVTGSNVPTQTEGRSRPVFPKHFCSCIPFGFQK